jgi:hypothetical protein
LLAATKIPLFPRGVPRSGGVFLLTPPKCEAFFIKNIQRLMPPTKVAKRHIKHRYLDEIADFIKLDRLLSVTQDLIFFSA